MAVKSSAGRLTTVARERLFEAGLGPGGIRALTLIGVLSVVRAISLVLIAESLAGSIAQLAAGSHGGSHAGWIGTVGIGILGAVLRAGSSWAVATVAAREAVAAKSALRGELAERIAAGGVDSGSTAVLASSGIDDLDDYYGSVIPAAVSALVIPVVLGARILSVDWPSAVVIALTIPLVPLFMALIGMHTRERTDAASRALNRLTDHLVELAHGLPVLVGLGRVDEQTAALDAIQRELRRRTSLTLRTAFLSALALELIATLSVALVAVMLGIRLLGGQVELGTALLVLLLAPECFTAVREVGAAFHASQNGTAALRRVRALLAGRRGAAARPVSGDVVVDDLSVRFDGRRDFAISHFSAVFPRGSVTAVVGPSGAGKSTLLATLAGTQDVAATITGRFRGVAPDRLALVPQAPRFFATTARGELELACSPDSAPAVVSTMVQEVLTNFGLDRVADRARAELSPGEARRLAVARAVLRVRAGATVVLLDEPTAHLDEQNAGRVRVALRDMARTAAVIVVSHDPEVVAAADSIVEISAWRPSAPVESGAGEPEVREPSFAAVPHGAPPATAPSHPQGSGSTLGALLRPAAGTWVLAVLLGTAAAALGLALTAVSAWLIVRAGEHPAIMYLLVAIVGVRFFGLGRSVARYAERLVTHRAILLATDSLRLRVWRSIAARGAGSRRLQEGGAAVDYLVTSLNEVRELVPRVVTPIAVGVLTLLGVGATVALIDPGVAAPVAVALVALAIAAILATRLGGGSAGAERVVARSELVERVVALGDAASDLRANGMSRRALDAVAVTGSRLAELDRRAAWSAGLGTAILSLGTAALAVLVPVIGSGAAAAPTASAPSAEIVAVVALLVLASVEPLAELQRAAQRVPALRTVLGRLRPFLDDTQPDGAGDLRGVLLDRTIASVRFDGLGARWPGVLEPVFTGLDAELEPGRWMVVEGPSGSGKTTLLTLLLGELAADTGRILADGRDVGSIRRGDWRARVAWCPQEAHVFDSTLRGNLLLARPRTDPVSADEMRAVLGRVGLAPLLARLPDGLDTRVGTSGSALSGGERQRLAVARALLSRAELLLLDEPTAHLDAPTAAAMMADIRVATRHRMVVLVTHRAEDREPSDRSIRLGQRVDVGATA